MSTRHLGNHVLVTGRFLSTAALTIAAGLVVWTALPLLAGGSAHVILTGSMAPRVNVGDVLVTSQVEASRLETGMVVLFRDPVDPDRLLSHRIQQINSDGTLVTQGDANPSADPAPVPAGNVLGVARLRIPWIGYPAVWFASGRYLLVLTTLLGLIATTTLAAWPRATAGHTESAPDAPGVADTDDTGIAAGTGATHPAPRVPAAGTGTEHQVTLRQLPAPRSSDPAGRTPDRTRAAATASAGGCLFPRPPDQVADGQDHGSHRCLGTAHGPGARPARAQPVRAQARPGATGSGSPAPARQDQQVR